MSKKTPYLSLIIPAYNSGPTLPRLLRSLARSRARDFEVVIGDDGSDPPLSSLFPPTSQLYDFPVKYVRLSANRGPAAARNLAVAQARGRILVFLDSDVEVYPQTLPRLARKFQKDPDLTALTGVWDKYQRTKRFFPQFKALRDWSYWINESDRGGYYYLFSTRIAAIRREIFQRLGGFNEQYRQMEDVELTYRIASRYAIIFAPDLRVHHEFEDFLPVLRKYFWRSFYWSKIWSIRRKFDTVATTTWETLTGCSGIASLGSLVLGMMLYFFLPLPLVKVLSLGGAGCFFALHCLLLRKFLRFVYREKGFLFMLKALATGLVLYLAIAAGAVYFFLHQAFTRAKMKK